MNSEDIKIQGFSVRRFVWLKFIIGCLKVSIATYIAGVAANSWTQMTVDAHILIILSCCLAALTYSDSYIDQVANRLAKGKLPIGEENGNTKFIKKDDIDEKAPINT